MWIIKPFEARMPYKDILVYASSHSFQCSEFLSSGNPIITKTSKFNKEKPLVRGAASSQAIPLVTTRMDLLKYMSFLFRPSAANDRDY
jgi:hypothetical protein